MTICWNASSRRLWREIEDSPIGWGPGPVPCRGGRRSGSPSGSPDRHRIPGPGPAADPDRPAPGPAHDWPTWTSSPPPAASGSSAPATASATTVRRSARPPGAVPPRRPRRAAGQRAPAGQFRRTAGRDDPADRGGDDRLPGTETGDLPAQDGVQPGHPADALRPFPHRRRLRSWTPSPGWTGGGTSSPTWPSSSPP